MIRYHKAVRLAPGVTLNLSRSGIGVSVGRKGLHVGVDATGKKYISGSLPGTGLSGRRYIKSRGDMQVMWTLVLLTFAFFFILYALLSN